MQQIKFKESVSLKQLLNSDGILYTFYNVKKNELFGEIAQCREVVVNRMEEYYAKEKSSLLKNIDKYSLAIGFCPEFSKESILRSQAFVHAAENTFGFKEHSEFFTSIEAKQKILAVKPATEWFIIQPVYSLLLLLLRLSPLTEGLPFDKEIKRLTDLKFGEYKTWIPLIPKRELRKVEKITESFVFEMVGTIREDRSLADSKPQLKNSLKLINALSNYGISIFRNDPVKNWDFLKSFGTNRVGCADFFSSFNASNERKSAHREIVSNELREVAQVKGPQWISSIGNKLTKIKK